MFYLNLKGNVKQLLILISISFKVRSCTLVCTLIAMD